MKKTIQYSLGILLGAGVCSFAMATRAPDLSTSANRLSYSLGAVMAKTFKAHGVNVNTMAFAAGFDDVMTGQKTRLSSEKIKQIVTNFQQQNQQKMRHQIQDMAKKNETAGRDFLASNKKNAGVKTTASGLQYKVITAGKGQPPASTDSVTVNYEGRLISGKVFDSSYKRGQPATFPVNGVIKGWQEALQLMRPGATWMLYIPADLAYGKNDVPGIGPNQTLIFKVQLLSVKGR
jgi:FKBP-type peptidyl-prolyl cis-trans isomerase FklB